MTTRLKRKTCALFIVIAAAAVACGLLLGNMQQRLAYSSYDDEITQCASGLSDLLAQAQDETDQNTQIYDNIYQSKAQSVAFMAQNDAGFAATDAKMDEYRQLLEVDNVMVVTRDGQVTAKAADTKANFAYARFNELRQVFETGKASAAVEVEVSDQGWLDRYYAARIDDNTMVVIEQDPTELRDLIATSGSTQSVLRNVSVGQDGYVIAVSAKNHLITYHPQSDLVGTDAYDAGFDAGDLEDGNRFRVTSNGADLYCGVQRIDDTYYIYAVPESTTLQSRNTTVGVILFVFVVVAACVALYGVFVMGDDERSGQEAAEKFSRLGPVSYNRTIGKKAAVLSVVGLAVIVVVSFYMQTLFALSSQSSSNAARAYQVSETIERNAERQSELEDQYSTRYLSKCRVAAYIVDQNPALATKEKLQELADVLQIAAVYVLDGNGDMIASSTPLRSYSLSSDPADSSYEFRELLGGKEELVQAVSTNDSTGEAQQFIGVATHDERGYASGIVQIAVRPKRLENLLKSVKIDHVLDGVKVGSAGFAFAVDKASGTIAYYPSDKVQGKSYEDAGLTKAQLKDGFSDYITVGGQTLFANCVETDDYYLFVAGPEGELMAERVPLTATTAAVAAVCLLAVFLVLTLDAGGEAAGVAAAGDVAAAGAAAPRPRDPQGRIVDVTLADGRVKKSESAVSRWLNRSFSWGEKTPEQKLGTVLRWFAGLGVFLVFLAVVLKDRTFSGNSVFAYILAGGWVRGLNIFAVTAAIMYACVAVTVAAVLRWLLRLLSDVLGARGETVCRLLSSTVKYGMLLCMLYWCLGALGVDTATLLAGAGIITLAVSFGAKDLVTDLLCGLFIIFEGEFRVGDVIAVGGNSGTVMEIGMRTTKINDGNGNVLVLRNSGISNVLNKTKMDSYATVNVNLPTGESLPYVENVLQRELPNVKKRVPAILDGPFYKGVVELTDSTMTLRVVATCAEKDRGALERSLKREMSILFARNNIAPYVVTYEHDEDEEKKTVAEKIRDAVELSEADRFVDEQTEAAQALGNEAADSSKE